MKFCKNCRLKVMGVTATNKFIPWEGCARKIIRNPYTNCLEFDKLVGFEENNSGNCKYYKKFLWKFWLNP